MVSPSRKRIVFRAIKSALLKRDDVEYWIIKMYEHQDAGTLDAEQIAELEAIVEAYYAEADAAETPAEPEPEAPATEGGDH